MSSAESPQFVSVDDYLAADVKSQTRNEYVEGWVRAMSGGSVRHNQVKVNRIHGHMRSGTGTRIRE